MNDASSTWRSTNMRFADDLLLVATTLPQVTQMLLDLAREAQSVGLELHFGETGMLSNVASRRRVSAVREVNVGGHNVSVLPHDERVV